MNEFLQIGIVGVALSGLVQLIKMKTGTNSAGAMWLTILLSIVLGGAYFFLKDTNVWESILGVLAASSAFYNFFIKPFQEK